MPPTGKKRTAASIAKQKATMRARKKQVKQSKTPGSIDALIYLRHAIKAADADDLEGLELYARLAKRALEGKE